MSDTEEEFESAESADEDESYGRRNPILKRDNDDRTDVISAVKTDANLTSESLSTPTIKSTLDDDEREEISVEDVGAWQVDDDDIILEERITEVSKLQVVDSIKGILEETKVHELSPQESLLKVSSDESLVYDGKRSVLDKLSNAAEKENKNSSWNWSSWGATILSSASSSVSTFTNQLEQGLNTVLETVESSLGAPSPEELASSQKSTISDEDEKLNSREGIDSDVKESNGSEQSGGNLIGSLVSGVSNSLTNALENKVIIGGLDTLELIGRKTMDILQDGDPGLKKKRAFLKGGKPNLSEVLREAKENVTEVLSTNPQGGKINRVNFGTIFDDHQGLVHLEALEMLSKQIEEKIQVYLLELTDEELCDVQSELKRIENACNIETLDDDDEAASSVDTGDVHRFANKIISDIKKLNTPINVDKLIEVQIGGQEWLRRVQNEQETRDNSTDAEDIYERAITFLAEFTAKTVEILHKTSELILVNELNDDNLDIMTGFVNTCCTEISVQSSGYSTCLNTASDDSADPDSVTPLITEVYLEASNSNTYIQDAFQLVVPILQFNFINAMKAS